MIASPLTGLTQKKVKFICSEACENYFQELKDRLTSAPVLTLLERSKGFVFYFDVLRVGLGRCRSPMGWLEVGEVALRGPQLVHEAYHLDFPNDLALVHHVLPISLLKKCFGDPTSIVSLNGLGVEENLSYEEVLVEILDKQVKKLRIKEVVFVKVL
ncbi:hypothetical protein MTR67_023044 [Solanum verrucosum]|uniref:Uncharacterized protein n=1 Tax=Solanum verrucosum TaxID=315347 RepID=A0AAF0R148_SOLVR|nr:hypothetical protein MTR67_023044 [Solanum verrucosum]